MKKRTENNTYGYEHFSDEYYKFIKEHGVCSYCKKTGVIKAFVSRHGSIMAKCGSPCGGELWAGCYQEAFQKNIAAKMLKKQIINKQKKGELS